MTIFKFQTGTLSMIYVSNKLTISFMFICLLFILLHELILMTYLTRDQRSGLRADCHTGQCGRGILRQLQKHQDREKISGFGKRGKRWKNLNRLLILQLWKRNFTELE